MIELKPAYLALPSKPLYANPILLNSTITGGLAVGLIIVYYPVHLTTFDCSPSSFDCWCLRLMI